jgi:uncharacterized protein DUF5666
MSIVRTLGRKTLAAVALAAFAFVPAVAQAKGHAKGEVEGSLSSISLAAKTLTVQSRGGQQTILKVDETSKLFRNGKRASLADLVVRDRIAAQFDRRTLRIDTAQARGPQLETTRGKFAAWNAAAKIIGVQTTQGTRRFRVDRSTLLVRNGQAARPLDLKVGDTLLVHSRGGRPPLAVDIQAQGEAEDEAEIEGEITAIAGGDVTIEPESGDPVVLHVDDSTEIRLGEHHGAEGGLDDLDVGQEVEAEYDPTTFLASKIKVEDDDDDEGEVEGTLFAINNASGTASVTIEPEDGGALVELFIDASTKITLDGEPATLDDLEVGQEAEAEFDPETMIASVLKVETEGEDDDHDTAEIQGVVTAVSDDSITIDPPSKNKPPITLGIDEDTDIKIRGKHKTAADIDVGDKAEVRYDKTTMIAESIRIGFHQGEDD